MFFNLLDTKNLGHAKATAGRKGNSGIAWHCTAIPISFLVLPIRPIENFTIQMIMIITSVSMN